MSEIEIPPEILEFEDVPSVDLSELKKGDVLKLDCGDYPDKAWQHWVIKIKSTVSKHGILADITETTDWQRNNKTEQFIARLGTVRTSPPPPNGQYYGNFLPSGTILRIRSDTEMSSLDFEYLRYSQSEMTEKIKGPRTSRSYGTREVIKMQLRKAPIKR